MELTFIVSFLTVTHVVQTSSASLGDSCNPAEYAASLDPRFLQIAAVIGQVTSSSQGNIHSQIFGKRASNGRATCVTSADCNLNNTFLCDQGTSRYISCSYNSQLGYLHPACKQGQCYCVIGSSNNTNTQLECNRQDDCLHLDSTCQKLHLDSHCVDGKCCCFSFQQKTCLNMSELTSWLQHLQEHKKCSSKAECDHLQGTCTPLFAESHCFDTKCCCFSIKQRACLNVTNTIPVVSTTTKDVKATVTYDTTTTATKPITSQTKKITPRTLSSPGTTSTTSQTTRTTTPSPPTTTSTTTSTTTKPITSPTTKTTTRTLSPPATTSKTSQTTRTTTPSPPPTTAATTRNNQATTSGKSPGPIECYQCGDEAAGLPCSPRELFDPHVLPRQCGSGYFCMTDVKQINGNQVVYKRCVDHFACVREWLQQSSDKDYCIHHGKVQLSGDFSCHFCCVKNACNSRVVPNNRTFFVQHHLNDY